jgi:hypothetical protein
MVQMTVAEIRPAQEGKAQASIIDTTGKRWGVPKALAVSYVVGISYDIVKYKESAFNGKIYYTIEQAVPIGSVAPAVNRSGGLPYKEPPNDNQRRLDIFVCGALNAVLGNASLDPLSIERRVLINSLIADWKATLGPQPQITRPAGPDEEMNDAIPF